MLMSPYPCVHFELGIWQLRGLARAIRYLHAYPSGPIFHGDIRGVRFCIFMYRFHAGNLAPGKLTNWQ